MKKLRIENEATYVSRLQAVIRELVAVLEAVEWEGEFEEERCCPFCKQIPEALPGQIGGFEGIGHLPACRLAAALARLKS